MATSVTHDTGSQPTWPLSTAKRTSTLPNPPSRVSSQTTTERKVIPASPCYKATVITAVTILVLAALAITLGSLVLSGKLDILTQSSLLSQTSAPFYLVIAGAATIGVGLIVGLAYNICSSCRNRHSTELLKSETL